MSAETHLGYCVLAIVLALCLMAQGSNMRAVGVPTVWIWRAWALVMAGAIGGVGGWIFGIMWVACDVVSMVLVYLVKRESDER